MPIAKMADYGGQVLVAAKNSYGSDLSRGMWVSRKFEDCDGMGVTVLTGVSGPGGILVQDLQYGAGETGGTEHSSALLIQGCTRVRFLGHASAKAGSWAKPVAGQTYLTYSALPTGIRLLTDMSADTSVHEIDDSTYAVVEILPNAAIMKQAIWDSPAALDADGLLADQATSATAVTTVTTFLNSQPVPRKITVLPGGTTADVPAGDVTIVGTNVYGETVTTSVTFAANASTTQTTSEALILTSITFPIQDGAGATYDVGWNDALGMPFPASAHLVESAYLATTAEGTLPMMTADVDEIEKNTCDPNSACNGSQLTVNFRI